MLFLLSCQHPSKYSRYSGHANTLSDTLGIQQTATREVQHFPLSHIYLFNMLCCDYFKMTLHMHGSDPVNFIGNQM